MSQNPLTPIQWPTSTLELRSLQKSAPGAASIRSWDTAPLVFARPERGGYHSTVPWRATFDAQARRTIGISLAPLESPIPGIFRA